MSQFPWRQTNTEDDTIKGSNPKGIEIKCAQVQAGMGLGTV